MSIRNAILHYIFGIDTDLTPYVEVKRRWPIMLRSTHDQVLIATQNTHSHAQAALIAQGKAMAEAVSGEPHQLRQITYNVINSDIEILQNLADLVDRHSGNEPAQWTLDEVKARALRRIAELKRVEVPHTIHHMTSADQFCEDCLDPLPKTQSLRRCARCISKQHQKEGVRS